LQAVKGIIITIATVYWVGDMEDSLDSSSTIAIAIAIGTTITVASDDTVIVSVYC
jgi:hypothetical protein